MTRVALLACLACSRGGSRPDAGGPGGPGEPCPSSGSGDCAAGLACRYMTSVNAHACTIACTTFADCEAAGFTDGCCAAPGGQSMKLCMSARWNACPPPDAGVDAAPIGPGGLCPTGGGCAGGLECWYMPSRDRFACTRRCGSFADCAAAGFPDGCCYVGAGSQGALPALCMDEASGVCPAPDAGTRVDAGPDARPIGPGGSCASGGTCADGLECIGSISEDARFCSRTCSTWADCASAGFVEGCCEPIPIDAEESIVMCFSAEWCPAPPDAGVSDATARGPGEPCAADSDCASGLACWYERAGDRWLRSCTTACRSFDDCRGAGFADGCCASGFDDRSLCMTAASGFCATPDGGAPSDR